MCNTKGVRNKNYLRSCPEHVGSSSLSLEILLLNLNVLCSVCGPFFGFLSFLLTFDLRFLCNPLVSSKCHLSIYIEANIV